MFDISNNTEFLTAIGIINAPEDVKATLIAGIENLAQQKLITEISDKLTDAQAEEFGNITDEKQAYDWLMANIPDFENIVTKVLSDIKQDILNRKSEVVGV